MQYIQYIKCLQNIQYQCVPPYPGPEGPKDTQQITHIPPIVGMIYTISK